MGYIKEKKLTKHVCQPGKSSLQTGILPGFWLLSTSLKNDMKQTLVCIVCDWLISKSTSKDMLKDGSRKIVAIHITLKVAIKPFTCRAKPWSAK